MSCIDKWNLAIQLIIINYDNHYNQQQQHESLIWKTYQTYKWWQTDGIRRPSLGQGQSCDREKPVDTIPINPTLLIHLRGCNTFFLSSQCLKSMLGLSTFLRQKSYFYIFKTTILNSEVNSLTGKRLKPQFKVVIKNKGQSGYNATWSRNFKQKYKILVKWFFFAKETEFNTYSYKDLISRGSAGYRHHFDTGFWGKNGFNIYAGKCLNWSKQGTHHVLKSVTMLVT